MITRRSVTLAGLAASSYQRILGANDRIQLGAIGTGGRCQGLMRQAAGPVGGCEFIAVCDVLPSRMRKGKEVAAAPQAREHGDFRKLLEDKAVNAVFIGAPDHWHVPMLIAAVDAGKDVYVEKPLTHRIDEGASAIDAVKRTGRIVQVGYQQRSYPHMIEARQRIAEGGIGQVTLAQSYWYQNYLRLNWGNEPVEAAELDWKAWLGPAAARPYEELRYRRWRWFWDYGGGTLTDLFSHWVDTIHWILDDYTPLAAQATGGNFRIQDFECPDTLTASFRYPKGFVVTYDSTIVQSYEDGGMVFRGDQGTLKLDRGRYELFTEEAAREQKTVRPTPVATGKSPREGTIDHIANFLDCVRSRQQPNSTVEHAVLAANAAHYGNLAFKTGRPVHPQTSARRGRPLFNGADLTGWLVDTKGVWTVRDGMIIGRHAGLKYNDFLRYTMEFEDFELRLKFRLVNGVGNSGVQFRSGNVEGTHEMIGYQADIGEKYWGCLYDESRRKKVLAGPAPEALAKLDRAGWHEYTIRAEGSLITLVLDGVRTVHYIEPDATVVRKGMIALQVHSGPGIEVHFKNLEITEL